MSTFKINAAGLSLIKSSEGFSASPYPDPATHAKPYTIGYGSTYYENGTPVTLADPPITEQRASDLLLGLLNHYELGVDSMTTDNINGNQFSALVSFSYNVGLANLKSSTLLKKVNANPSDPTIRNEFLRWNKANHVVMAGLTKRREKEADLYFS